MKKLLQINPVLRINTSTGRIMQEIGELAMQNGWESYIAYSRGRDGVKSCKSEIIPIGGKWSVMWHGIMTRFFDRHGLASSGATYRFINQIEKIKPDIIHIHNLHGYFLNYSILFRYLSHCGIPVVWTIHDCWLYTGHCYYYSYVKCNKWQTECRRCTQKKRFPASFLFDRSHKNFIDKKNAFTSIPYDKLTIVPVSKWIESELRKSFLQHYKIHVIHNGIDLNIFKIYPEQNIKKKYGLQKKRILLGVASIWSEEKGLYDFIKLADFLSEDEIIVLVGIKAEQEKLLPNNILGISRTENIRQLAELYSAADSFVNPTWQDNYPTVNMESIACGTPVVTYQTGGSVEVITDKTGFIVEQGDIEGIVNAIRHIARRGKQYYSVQCRDYALKHFNKEERYKEYLDLYEKLISEL